MPVKRIQHLFLVRLWAETTEDMLQPSWRGMVEHTASGQKLYFTTLDDLMAFLAAQLEASIRPSADRVGEITPTS